jgi:hypothetical protein
MNTAITTRPTTTTFTSTRKSMRTEITTETTIRQSFTVHTTHRDGIATLDHADELRASQLATVAHEELEWFFTSNDASGSAVQARALIEGWLGALVLPREAA